MRWDFIASLFFNSPILKANITVILLLLFTSGFSRQRSDIKLIIKQLENNSEQQVLISSTIDDQVERLDSSSAFNTLTQLKAEAAGNPWLQARLLAIEARLLTKFQGFLPYKLEPIQALYEQALKKAMEAKDDMLVAEVCRKYALFCDRLNLIEKAMFYSLKSLEIQEEHGIDKFPSPLDFYYTNADILYKVGEYELCNSQLNKVIRLLQTHSALFPHYYALNTVGLACYKLNKFDSAIYWYRAALPSAIQRKDTAWVGIITGNIGDVYFKEKKYDSARYYLLKEYDIVKNSKVEQRSAFNSLTIVARILAYEGKADSAYRLIKRAEPVLFDPYFSDNRSVYIARAEVYQALHKNDSAAIFFNLFQHQEDSIRERQLRSRVDVTLVKLDYEKSQQVITQMIAERKQEKEKQYMLVAGIVLAIVIGVVIYRQQLQRSRLEKELLLQQKSAAEEHVVAAREQLDQFTAHIIEKNDMIEKLQGQLEQRHQTIHEELLTQTILTDDDWNRFKMLFERARPGFFEYLQNTAPGITPAELRLAALLQLKLDTKNIAAMQGISTDAVRKSKSRLRQRLNITLEDGLEEFIYAIPLKL